MWAVIASFGMKLTMMSHSCEFVKIDPPAVPTVIGLFGGLLFLLGDLGKRYMEVSPMY